MECPGLCHHGGVTCRIGSSEITDGTGMRDCCVTCRIGSSEKVRHLERGRAGVTCRIGSSEKERLSLILK